MELCVSESELKTLTHTYTQRHTHPRGVAKCGSSSHVVVCAASEAPSQKSYCPSFKNAIVQICQAPQ